MFFQHSLAVALFFVFAPLAPIGATCPWSVTYETVVRDFYANTRYVCQSEKATIHYVQRSARFTCCAFDMEACAKSKAIYEYFRNEIEVIPSAHASCYYNFFILYYSICECPGKVKPPTTVIPINDPLCGLSGSPQPRIVGGEKTLPCEFPWMVQFTAGDFLCGGTIIDTKHIVTATHCVFLANSSQMYITVGSNNLRKGLKIGIESVVTHPLYKHDSKGHYNDIAILTLADELPYNQCIRPICLPSENIEDTQNCYVIGWGKNSSMGIIQRYLHKVKVPIMRPEICKRYVQAYGPGQICAGYLKGGKDACVGDSGGPLMCQSNGRWVLAGVVSYGYKCAEVNHPGVYADVRYYLNWISNNLQ